MTKKTNAWQVATDYLDTIKRDYHTAEFGYSAWNPPNTTLTVSERLIPILMELSPVATQFYWQCVSKLKRNHDPAYAILIVLGPEDYSFSKRTFQRYLKELTDHKLLIHAHGDLFIVNPVFCHKLFKPKFEIEI